AHASPSLSASWPMVEVPYQRPACVDRPVKLVYGRLRLANPPTHRQLQARRQEQRLVPPQFFNVAHVVSPSTASSRISSRASSRASWSVSVSLPSQSQRSMSISFSRPSRKATSLFSLISSSS